MSTSPRTSPGRTRTQDPDVPGFRCLQGLINLLPSGPNDGCLIVVKGGHSLSRQFHGEIRWRGERIPAWTTWTREWHGFTERGIHWLKDHNCEWYKVEAGSGDLIIWDSRPPHYSVSLSSNQGRMAVYTCYMLGRWLWPHQCSHPVPMPLIGSMVAIKEFLQHWVIEIYQVHS